MCHAHSTSLGQILRTAEARTGDETISLEQGRPIDARRVNVVPLITSGITPGNDSSTTVHVFVPTEAAVRAVSDSPSLWPSSQVVKLTNHVATFEVPVSSGAFDENYRLEILGDYGSGAEIGSFRVARPPADVFE